MPQLLIVADDFTGALDTSVQFSKQGYRTCVTTAYPPELADIEESIDVLVADTESRHLSPKEAYERTFRWMDLAKEHDIQILYKKTDSTLRGNVGAELQAALDASGRSKAVFAPALPRLGRTVIGGEVFFQGVPLADTVFANDPFTPVRSSALADIIHSTAPELPTCTTTPSSFLDAYCDAPSGSVITVDAQTDTQLHEIALSAFGLREKVVLAGCAGLAQMVPCMLKRSCLPIPNHPLADCCLFVSGSVNSIAIEQVHYAEKIGIPSLLLQPGQLLKPGYWNTHEGKLLLEELSDSLRANRCLILKTADSEEDTACVRRYAKTHGIPDGSLHLLLADQLGLLTAKLVDRNDLKLITVFGGDTLYGVLNHLQVKRITPESEILPGVVQSVFSSEHGLRYVVSKAGGFGEEDMIRTILRNYNITPVKEAVAAI